MQVIQQITNSYSSGKRMANIVEPKFSSVQTRLLLKHGALDNEVAKVQNTSQTATSLVLTSLIKDRYQTIQINIASI